MDKQLRWTLQLRSFHPFLVLCGRRLFIPRCNGHPESYGCHENPLLGEYFPPLFSSELLLMYPVF